MIGTGIEVVENKLYNVEGKEVLLNGERNNNLIRCQAFADCLMPKNVVGVYGCRLRLYGNQ